MPKLPNATPLRKSSNTAAMNNSRPSVLGFAAIWLCLAAAASAAGLLHKVPMPFPQILIFLLTNLLLLLFWKNPSLHTWATQESLRTLVLIHVIRLVAGSSFLLLYHQGELPFAFAVPGGWGDIVVGLLALAVFCLAPGAG